MIQLSKDKWRLETELRCHKPASKAIIESSNQWLYVGGALGLMFVYWSKCLLDAGFAGVCKLRQRKQRPKSSTFPYHQLIFCACVLYGFLIVTHTNTHWKKPNTSYKCRIAAVFSESQHVLNIHVQHTVYCIPTSRDTCNHKRYQKHHIDSAHEEGLSSYRLLHKNLHTCLLDLWKKWYMLNTECR